MERQKPTEPSDLQGRRRVLEANIQVIQSRSHQSPRNLDEEGKLIDSLNRTISGRLALKSVIAENLLIGTKARGKRNFYRLIPRLKNVEHFELLGAGAEPEQLEPILGVAIGGNLSHRAQRDEWYLVCGRGDFLLIPLTGIKKIEVELFKSTWLSLKSVLSST